MFAKEFEWVIEIASIGKVRVTSKLINDLAKYRQLDSQSLESGGVLVGKHLKSGGVLLIDDFTPPLSTDRQGRYNYHRSKEHSLLVRNIWKKSDHESTYVGLWHSHPEDIPNYSSVDKKDWMVALSSSKYEGKSLYFFIIGKICIRCWLGSSGKFRNSLKLVGELNFKN